MNPDAERSSGQTLVLALVLMVILVLAALLLFDVQSVIRGKLKAETAAQAAALTAANWQRESLNLIGELNLINASTALLELLPGRMNGNAEVLEKYLACDQVLTEMQTRIGFTGPLIGYGAAEQAAKNNGFNGPGREINAALQLYRNKVTFNQDDRYPDLVRGYFWKRPYLGMLASIGDIQLAVRPSGNFAGVANVSPEWLGDESLYRAIRSRNWCHPTLRWLLKNYGDAFWQGEWFRVDLYPARFSGESEIFTLHVGPEVPAAEFGRGDELLRLLEEYRLEYDDMPPGRPTLFYYGNHWHRGNPYYTGPDLTLWQGPERDGGGDYYYLRSNLRDSARYGGPVAAVEILQPMGTVSRYEASGDDRLVREQGDLELTVGGYAVARPIGELSGGDPPSESGVVLPVFDLSVLIPSTMLRHRMLPVGRNIFEEFLVWLSYTGDLSLENDPPSGSLNYLEALLLLSRASWRHQGWHPDWATARMAPEEFARAFFRDEWPGDPPGWLQLPVAYRDRSGRYPDNKLTTVEAGGRTEYHWGDRYIVRNADGNFDINDRISCLGGSSGGYQGVNTGPGRK